MDSVDVLVIGGGISGLAFAFHAARAGREVTVLEERPEAGGCLCTHRTGEGFWLELGAHTAYNSYGGFLEIIEDAVGLKRLVPRAKVPFRVLAEGQVRAIPKELSKLELLRSAPRLFTTKKDGKTVAEYYGRIVGRRNYDRLFRRLFAAVPSQPADDFPADMLFKRRPRRKDVLRSFTVERGLMTVAEEVARRPRVRLVASTAAAALARAGDGWVVKTGDGRELRAAVVALAVPPPVGAALAKDAIPDLAAALARIRVAGVVSTGVVVRRDAVQLPKVAGIIPLDDRFFSLVSRDVVPDPRWRGFAFHFRAGTPEPDRLAAVEAVLGVARARFEAVVSREVVLPSPAVGHHHITAAIDRAVAGATLAVCGNYFAGLSIEDCVGRSITEAKRLAAAG